MNFKRLKNLRETRKLSQNNVATAAGITRQQYFRIERGLSGTTLGTAQKMADFFKVELAYLLTKDEEGLSCVDPRLLKEAERITALGPEKVEQAHRVLQALAPCFIFFVVASSLGSLLQAISHILYYARDFDSFTRFLKKNLTLLFCHFATLPLCLTTWFCKQILYCWKGVLASDQPIVTRRYGHGGIEGSFSFDASG